MGDDTCGYALQTDGWINGCICFCIQLALGIQAFPNNHKIASIYAKELFLSSNEPLLMHEKWIITNPMFNGNVK